jgi:hypothetical protein
MCCGITNEVISTVNGHLLPRQQGTMIARRKEAQTPISTSMFSVNRDYKTYVTGWALGKCNGVVLCLTFTPLCFLSGSIHATGNRHTTCISEVEGRSRTNTTRSLCHPQYTITRPCYIRSLPAGSVGSAGSHRDINATRDADDWEPKRASGLCIPILTQQIS